MTLLGRFYKRYADHAVARHTIFIVTGKSTSELEGKQDAVADAGVDRFVTPEDRLKVSDVVLDRAAVLVTKFRLLKLLMSNADPVLTSRVILDRMWEPEYTSDSGKLAAHMLRLWKKLERAPHRSRHLQRQVVPGSSSSTTSSRPLGKAGERFEVEVQGDLTVVITIRGWQQLVHRPAMHGTPSSNRVDSYAVGIAFLVIDNKAGAARSCYTLRHLAVPDGSKAGAMLTTTAHGTITRPAAVKAIKGGAGSFSCIPLEDSTVKNLAKRFGEILDEGQRRLIVAVDDRTSHIVSLLAAKLDKRRGEHGGNIVVSGMIDKLLTSAESITGGDLVRSASNRTRVA
ncbi:hypothetical protein QBC33DRAFT_564329 [Phialemonium atrogriseum]|uniref:OmpR/PhoB-type domain-containing protein n=1 Tax=Phialemonium atrogriseum TaxID=1093897 RepID=A0AAJ0FI94_9PEZI|nr:uncharacterized protein QBC33DRAFT_564329 [Phialemonium atrogriseum]KAK1761880.1 hypothetical protein QBC33DRAFT_564329 [Phialemonium atrogriseum]